MIKRITLVLLLLALIVSFVGCEKQPIEKAQKRIVEIGEAFLDYEMGAEEAIEALDGVIIPETEGRGQDLLETSRDVLIYMIEDAQEGEATYEKIENHVSSIKYRDYTE